MVLKILEKYLLGVRNFYLFWWGGGGVIIGGVTEVEKFTLRELEIPINTFYHVYHIKIFSFPFFIFQAL